jgi:hypothetical protein
VFAGAHSYLSIDKAEFWKEFSGPRRSVSEVQHHAVHCAKRNLLRDANHDKRLHPLF